MNRREKRLTLLLVVMTVLITVFVGCGKNKQSQETAAVAEKNAVKQIRIMAPNMYFPFIIADKKGFFQEAFGDDTEVIFTIADSGSAIMETMTSGEVEFAALGDMPVIQAKANGLDVKVISSLFRSTSGYQLIAAKDSGIKSISDLKGKRVAVMSGSTNHKLFLKYLDSENLTENDMEVVYLKNKDQLAAFVANSVDAAVTQVPTSTTIEAKAGAYEVVDANGYDDILTVIAGNNEYMKENPKEAKAFLQAIFKATDWIENNKEEAIQIVVDEMGDSYENVELYYNTRTFEYSLDDSVKMALEDTISYLYDQGTIKSEPKVEDIVDSTYLKELGVNSDE